MPNTNRSLGVYLKTGNPDTENNESLYAAGELGVAYDYNDRASQVVQVDSGVGANTGPGAVAANQVAFWKSKANKIVTNDNAQAEGTADGAPNNVAGIFRVAPTAGYYIHILQRGRNIAVSDDGTCDTVGETAVADATADQARAVGIAKGTAPTYKPIGIVRTPSVANVAYVDVDIPNIP